MKSKSQFLLKIIPLFTLFYGTCYSSSLVQFKEGNVAQVSNPAYNSIGALPPILSPIRLFGSTYDSSPDAKVLGLSRQAAQDGRIFHRVSSVIDPHTRLSNNIAIIFAAPTDKLGVEGVYFALAENPYTSQDHNYNQITNDLNLISSAKGTPYSQSIALMDGKYKDRFAVTFTFIENNLPVGYICILDKYGRSRPSDIKKTQTDVSGLELAAIPGSEYVAALYVANNKLNFAVIDPSSGKVIKSNSYTPSAKGISLTLKGVDKDGSIIYYSSNKGRSGSAVAVNKNLDLKKITLSKNYDITFEKIKDGYISGSENDNPQILYLQNGYILETHTVDKKGTLGYLLMDTNGKVVRAPS